jgi:hypothetical protein
MELQKINTIDDVIASLNSIIEQSQLAGDTSGYFAALYRKVTIRVKEEIASGFFDDGPRMEQLDVVFAKRYLDAYHSYHNNLPVTDVWRKTFELSDKYWPIVLQHLLMGMNAHINLDLGIAAAEVAKGKKLATLENDFNRINEILSSLVREVQGNLSLVWPALKYILKWSGKIDDYLIDFSMKLARDGAWKFANEYSLITEPDQANAISNRDKKVAAKVNLVLKPGLMATFALRIIRITERGSVADKITKLK